MSEVATPTESLRHGCRWLRLTLWLLALAVVFVCALPFGLRLGIEYWLNEQPDMTAQLGDVDLSLFSGALQLEDLDLYQHQQRVLAAKKITVEINWWPLLNRQLFVEEITVEEGVVCLTQQQDTPLTIAGFTLVDEPTSEPAVLTDVADKQKAPAWGIHSGQISVRNVELIYQTPTLNLAVIVNQLSIDPIVSWRSELLSPFRADLLINGSALKLAGKIAPFSSQTLADTSISLTGFELENLATLLDRVGLSDVSGAVGCDLQLMVAKVENETEAVTFAITGKVQANHLRGGTPQLFISRLTSRWQGDVRFVLASVPELVFKGDLSCSDVDLDLLASGLKIEQSQLVWQGKGALREDKITLGGDVALTGLTIEDLARGRQLLSVQQFDLNDLSVDGSEKISTGAIVAQKVLALQRGAQADSSHSVAIEQTSLASLSLRRLSQLDLSALHLAGVKAGLNRTVSGALDFQEWFPPSVASVANAQQPKSEPEAEPAFAIRVDEIKIDQNSEMRWLDSTVTPPVAVVFNDLLLQIDDLDSRLPQQQSSVVFSSALDRYSRFTINGHVQPFSQPPSAELVGALRGFNVTTISPYSEKGVGYQIQQGQLNLDFALPIDNGMLALESDINLKQLRLQALSAEYEMNASQSIGLPVNLALSLLRDRDGDIDLHLPVHGDLRDPNVHIGSIVRRAIVHTLRNTVMLPLAPLGIVVKAGNLIGVGNSLNFDRVIFDAGTAVMATSSQDYLANVAILLSERPQLSVSASGLYTEADRRVLMLKEGDVDLIRKMGRALADQRAAMVKDELLLGGVEPTQVLLRQPAADVVTGAPGVDLVLQ